MALLNQAKAHPDHSPGSRIRVRCKRKIEYCRKIMVTNPKKPDSVNSSIQENFTGRISIEILNHPSHRSPTFGLTGDVSKRQDLLSAISYYLMSRFYGTIGG